MTDDQIEAAAEAMCRDIAGMSWAEAPETVRGYLRRLARAALEAAERVSWSSDMDAAPHDELLMLGWHDKRDGWVTAIDCASWGWQTVTVSNRSRHSWATHWRPIPESPQ